ncbi:GreA/GreB family elongation factor [Vreelandella neptunia]|uniref:GreA/GreB family elongation factor n=1 Tax=Vreelandella neptunia TaxID=115551 RepID=A0ABZ0YJ64_9GAMM|nr:GreA/GreB family elongation factor [Halomonas neptunia]MDN3562075.1 GreA/GreB family elongation factor [Halomonas neptunia]WQH11778.1 GreA/GreB family elongation factor [Halomonas neptunia]
MSNHYYVTHKGLNALCQKQKELSKEIERCTRAMGHSAKLDNDLRENPEFLQLRTKVTYELPNRVAELQNVIRQAKLIEDAEYLLNEDFYEVMPGMEVEMETEDGELRVHTLLGYEEGDPKKGIVSYLSPVGAELLNRTIGDEVELPMRGKLIRYEIINIKRSPYLE